MREPSPPVTQFDSVGAWDAGPFDNDDAADFSSELDDADPNQRVVLVRAALQAALDPDEGDSDEDEAQPKAVAAAAVVAAARFGAPVDSGYAPKFLGAEEDGLSVADDLVELAVAALDRIADSDTEWAELFGEAGTLDTLRDALTA
ncbi:hypothetical protein Val02_57160 [Virgisporangium aliadipatigenens]|uniref:DUF4259 domain-containing protein n=1 Tax=Virgisporangium aliadipatigenens TaxID=741659 RepID=A0A8J3YS21_9ACTN|nr:hypothetical protein Val02_57160 [Virgisporangium aliadipatigenens]